MISREVDIRREVQPRIDHPMASVDVYDAEFFGRGVGGLSKVSKDLKYHLLQRKFEDERTRQEIEKDKSLTELREELIKRRDERRKNELEDMRLGREYLQEFHAHGVELWRKAQIKTLERDQRDLKFEKLMMARLIAGRIGVREKHTDDCESGIAGSSRACNGSASTRANT